MGQKEKLRQGHDRKMKHLETQHAIQKSLAINKQRLEKIKARQGVLTDIHEEVKTKLVKDLKNDAQNKTFVTKLITQGLLMFLENEVSIRCRQSDVSLVQSCLKDAREYAKVIKKETGVDKSVNISVDQTQFLPATSLGGVIL